MLASLGRDGDTDHLAGTALEDEDVTNADEVAGNGDGLGVAAATWLNNADILAEAIPVAGRASLGDDDLLFVVGVHDALGNTLHTTAEGVVVTLVVVVTHLASRGFFLHGRLDGSRLGGRGRVVGVPRSGGGDGVDLLAGVRGRAVRLDGRQGLVGAVVGVSVIPVLVFCLGLEAARIGDVKSAGLVVVEGVVDGGLVAGVVRDVDVVGRVGATTVLFLGDVELVGQSLVVNSGSFLAGNSSVGLAVTFAGEIYLRITLLAETLVGRRSLNLSWNLILSLSLVVGVGSSGSIANIDFLLSVDLRVRERSSDSSIFPFDARSAVKFGFSLYSLGQSSSLRDSVTPVRRREDTEWDGNSRVKVQIDCPLGVFPRMPFELLRNNSKGETRKDLTWEKSSQRAGGGAGNGERKVRAALTFLFLALERQFRFREGATSSMMQIGRAHV